MTCNLVISPIGDHSVHRTWIEGPDTPNFDLFLLYYGNGSDPVQPGAKFYVRRKGFKWEHVHYVAEEHFASLQHYDRIWCPDDDIACDTAGVNLLFELFEHYQLKLAQPAIAKGDFSFRGLTQRRGNILRYTPYVEVMCPIFTREAFFQVKPTFLENRSGWGLDWIWPKHFAKHEMAIIDKVGIHHTGPLGKGEHYQHLAALGIDPYRDFDETVARHGGIDWSLHRAMLRGNLRMKRVKDPTDGRSWLERLRDHIQWMQQKRSAA
ncbi:MAG: hypothetical protein IT427_12205 [Pirellulales bacterium]|nr:hypothetical protein [Pirellulales bacterium]